MMYLGPSAIRDIASTATRRGIDADVIEWLLPGGHPDQRAGSPRNVVLLATAGQALLTVDDDTRCEVWRHGQADEGMAFVGHVDPRHTDVHGDRAAALASIEREDVDLLAVHEMLLGRSVGALAEINRSDNDISALCSHLAPAVEGREPAWRVRATWTGIAGDAAVFCPYPLIFSTGITREALASSKKRFHTALSSREVSRVVRRATVTDEPWLMTYCAALDNRTPLPPFSPIGLNEDGLFGSMLRIVEPGAFIGQLPVGIVHDSDRDTGYDEGAIASATWIRFADVVQWLIASWAPPEGEVPVFERMRLLGAHLRALSESSPAVFEDRIATLARESRWRLLGACEMFLAGPFDYPKFWLAAFARFQRAVLASLASARLVIPLEYRDEPDTAAAMSRLASNVGMFGRALAAWPALWEAHRQHPLPVIE